MKLLVLADLHLEFGQPLRAPDGTAFDVVVLAGDIHSPGVEAVRWAQQEASFAGKPIVMVPGSHEFYGCALDAELKKMRPAAAGSNVHIALDAVAAYGPLRLAPVVHDPTRASRPWSSSPPDRKAGWWTPRAPTRVCRPG